MFIGFLCRIDCRSCSRGFWARYLFGWKLVSRICRVEIATRLFYWLLTFYVIYDIFLSSIKEVYHDEQVLDDRGSVLRRPDPGLHYRGGLSRVRVVLQ